MKLIIDIPEQGFSACKLWVKNRVATWQDEIIANGTPLPKGHGDLIDRDKLSPKIRGAKSIVAVLEAPAIIEADKENDNETNN